jgi:hypothetical protein
MSDEEFLKRWSRRKQEARANKEDKSAEHAPLPAEAAATAPAVPPEPEIDISKLPPLDSITAATDIADFLRKGIPAELRSAALRRAWAADPAIRDFVGLAENAWDFTDPNAIPGFGALQDTPEQIGAMVERMLGGARDAAEKLPADLSEKEQAQEKQPQDPGIAAAEAPTEADVVAMRQAEEPEEPDAATQPEASDESGDVEPVRRRTHGGALPS